MTQTTDFWIRQLLGNLHGITLKGKCHDCGADVSVCVDKDGDDYILDLPVWKYEEEDKPYFKCGECAIINPKLTNFQPCEVYSRVVGYLRPVKQWNFGKQAEFQLRKDFVI